jgi:uncharacterized protein (TIGR03067 family)
MRTAAVLLALCALAALAGRAADPEPPGDAKAELKKLKGTWTVTKAVFGGREAKAPPGMTYTLMTYTFDGDKLTRTTPFGKVYTNDKGKGIDERKQAYKVKIDTKKKPYTIEMIPEGKDKGQVGIFKVEKGELHLATGRVKGQVPADFKGADVAVMVMARKKK